MINSGAILKGVFVTFGSFAFSYSLLQVPQAPPLQEPHWLGSEHASPFTVHEGASALAKLPPPAAGKSHWEDRTTVLSLSHDQILNPKEQELFLKVNARRGEPLMTPEEFLQAIHTPSAFAPLEQIPPQLTIPAGIRHQVQEVVQIYRDKLETLFPGDEMYLYSDRLGSLVMVVDHVVDHFDGTLTWQGHLKGLDRNYRISFTQGPLSTLAYLATPQGHYQLEAHGKYGWLVPTRPSPYGMDASGYVVRVRNLAP